MSRFKELRQKARQLKKEFKFNEKKELADITVFLKENNTELVELTASFGALYILVGNEGNFETQNLRQFTFLLSYLLALIKSSDMPKEVKIELALFLVDAIKENKV